MSEKVLVMLSGGQDSTTCLTWAIKKWGRKNVCALGFSYSQQHVIELNQAKIICKILNVPFEVINLDFIKQLGDSALLQNSSIEVRHDINKKPSTWVPGRNYLFLGIATAYGHHKKINNFVTGVTVSDFINFLPLSSEWVAGFFDAEGCISHSRNSGGNKTKYPTISIYQNDRDILERIKTFFGVGYVGKQTTGYMWRVNHRKQIMQVVDKLIPYIQHPEKREKYNIIAKEFNLPIITEFKQMTDEWLIGFWEGDGCIAQQKYIQTKENKMFKYPLIIFTQKNKVMLEAIQTYIGKGSITHNTKNDVYNLYIPGGITEESYLLDLLKTKIRTMPRRQQFVTKYLESGIPVNNIHPHYPDCTPEFIFYAEKALQQAMDNPCIKIYTPLMWLTKADSIRLMQQLGNIDLLKYTHTCYLGHRPACGKCPSCILRLKGFKEAGIKDPLEYEIEVNWENVN